MNARTHLPPLLTRREAIKTGAVALASVAIPISSATPSRKKKVIVIGAGLAGLSCAHQLRERGHEVTVLEASRRTGGHIKTISAPLDDGLYADVGAEQFPKPGYDAIWNYIEQFKLKPLRWARYDEHYRKIGEKWIREADLSTPETLSAFGFNAQEKDYIREHGWHELPLLYFRPYIEKIRDEYQPLGVGLDHLDHVLTADLMAQDGASDAAIRFFAQSRRSSAAKPPTRSDVSALARIWNAAILQLRGLPLRPKEVYHLEGGNQTLPDALAASLAGRIRKNCPVTEIAHDGTSVLVRFTEEEKHRELIADFAVLAVSPLVLAGLKVTPGWSPEKAYAVSNVTMGMGSRVLLQAANAFWEGDIPSINFLTGNRFMSSVSLTATEVPTQRKLLFGTGQATQTPEQTLEAFRSFYPGKAKDTIEKVIVHQWWKEEPTCIGCERNAFPLGELAKIWPHLIQPVGRIHFAGAAYDNHWRGTEAATRSAHRAARLIDSA